MKKIAIFGTSGFAREVADICIELEYKLILFLSAPGEDNDCISGMEVKSESEVEELHRNGFDFAMGMGDPKVRKKISLNYKHLNFPNLIHPDTSFGLNQLDEISKSKGNIICAGCRLTNNIVFGNFIVLNHNTCIGHDSIICDFVSAMSGALIAGNVELSECSYLGSGSIILQGSYHKKIKIGENTVIGTASLVIKSVKPNITVFGVPCKQISK